MPPRTGGRIATPRPRPAEESTLLGGLARTLGSEFEERRVLDLEAEERKRRREMEDLQKQSLQQGLTFNRAQALRNIFGLEEVPGPRRPAPRGELEPRRIGTTGGTGVGLQLGAVPQDRPRGGVGIQTPEAPQLEDRGPIMLPGPMQMRKLEPARDPTIVNPELLPQQPGQEFDFTKFERQFELPEGSLAQAFDKNPVGALNIMVDKAQAAGGATSAQLNSIRQMVALRVQAVSDQLEFDVLDPQEEQILRDQIDAMTIGLLDAATGGKQVLDPDDILDELEILFPDASDADLARRATRIQRVRAAATEFGGRPGMQPLEPGS